jgi:hypothetical protein
MSRKPAIRLAPSAVAAASDLPSAAALSISDLADVDANPTPIRVVRDYASQGPFANGADGSFGVIGCSYKGRTNMMLDIVHRRLVQFGLPMREQWQPTCARWDVLLPPHAPDACQDPQTLARFIDLHRMPAQQDLAVLITLRFAQESLLHRGWELARGFALQRLATERETPVVAAFHVPQIAGRRSKPHCHLLMSARRIIGSHSADFVTDLLDAGGKTLAGDMWRDWCAEHG